MALPVDKIMRNGMIIMHLIYAVTDKYHFSRHNA